MKDALQPNRTIIRARRGNGPLHEAAVEAVVMSVGESTTTKGCEGLPCASTMDSSVYVFEWAVRAKRCSSAIVFPGLDNQCVKLLEELHIMGQIVHKQRLEVIVSCLFPDEIML